MCGETLLIGYGNPGRRDDGLGPALAEELERRSVPGVTVESNYQLTVEDAAAIAEHDSVVFADAAVSGPEPFAFRRVSPAEDGVEFSSHSLSPEALLAMSRRLFAADTKGYALAIRGYEFDTFSESLSPQAAANLEAAARFLEGVLRNGLLEDAASAGLSAGPA
jgi:hydrogenase maturation protease